MKRVIALAVLVVASLAGCGGSGNGGEGRVRVVAGFYPLAEAVRQVGGDAVTVVDLTPAGGEAHDLELTPDAIDDIEDADLVVHLSGFQPAVDDAIERADARVVDVREVVDIEGDDPHFWLDPRRMAAAVTAIEEALRDVAPSGADADTFAPNAERHRSELEALDRDAAASLGRCQRRELVSAHNAFGYLAARYGLEAHAVTGIDPEAEPDPEAIARLTRLVRERGVTTVFTEPLASEGLARTLAREAGVSVAVLDPIESLSADAREEGATYLSVMRDNVRAIAEALGCA